MGLEEKYGGLECGAGQLVAEAGGLAGGARHALHGARLFFVGFKAWKAVTLGRPAPDGGFGWGHLKSEWLAA